MKRPEDYMLFPSGAGSGKVVTLAEITKKYVEFLEDRRVWLTRPEDFRLKGSQEWYRDVYLNSVYWREYVRPYMLRRAENKCESCGRGNIALDVHHKTYECLGFESPDDMMVLCRDCHDEIHGGPAIEVTP